MNNLNLVDTLARKLANDMSFDNTAWDGLPEHDDGSFIDCKDRYRECVWSMLAMIHAGPYPTVIGAWERNIDRDADCDAIAAYHEVFVDDETPDPLDVDAAEDALMLLDTG